MEHLNQAIQRYPYCYGCKQPIKDFYLLNVYPDVNFHANCLKCFECGTLLDEAGVCFLEDGKIYCKVDHDRLFRIRCEVCDGIFIRDEMVMWANASIVYHVQCFKCSKCNKVISTGDTYLYHKKKIYCCVEHQIDANKSSVASNINGLIDHNNNDESNQQQQQSVAPQQQSVHQQQYPHHQTVDQRQSQQISPQQLQCFQQNNISELHHQLTRSSPSTSPTESTGKPPRYRTPMTEVQLSILKSFYKSNSRPDSQTRENLARMTGLNVRVVRVWFQNKRCKDKRDTPWKNI